MTTLKEGIFKGRLISEAISFIRKFSGEVIVVKFGGSALSSPEKLKSFASDIVMLKNCGVEVILVHGVGSHIDEIFKKFNKQSSYVDNIRISTKEDTELIEMILSGYINKQIVSAINAAGGIAIGLSGKDASLLSATKMRKTKRETDSNIERLVDFGYLGIPAKVNPQIFEILSESDAIPVISPIGFDENGNTYTINADNVAGVIAIALRAHRLVLMTEFDGLYGEDGALISNLTRLEAESLKKNKIIKGPSAYKLEVCLDAVKNGVFGAHIINATKEHTLLLEILTKEGSGTMITGDESLFFDYEFED